MPLHEILGFILGVWLVAVLFALSEIEHNTRETRFAAETIRNIVEKMARGDPK